MNLIFNGEVRPMRSPRWEAITQIITKFIDAGHPRLALAALALVMIGSVGAVGAGALVYAVSTKSLACEAVSDSCPRQ